MEKVFSIAIDGPGGAGKSSVAKMIARRLNAVYLDTGAMYRAVGLYMTRLGIPLDDAPAVIAQVLQTPLRVSARDGLQVTWLGDEDVSEAIRTPEMSMAASAVSAIPEVRAHLVEMQREIARGQAVVMDGRDIGTKVLPNATLKIFLTASPEVRARRRWLEQQAKGSDETFEKVLEELIRRDWADTHRAASPLTRAEDAVEVDTSNMTAEEVVERIVTLALKAIGERA